MVRAFGDSVADGRSSGIGATPVPADAADVDCGVELRIMALLGRGRKLSKKRLKDRCCFDLDGADLPPCEGPTTSATHPTCSGAAMITPRYLAVKGRAIPVDGVPRRRRAAPRMSGTGRAVEPGPRDGVGRVQVRSDRVEKRAHAIGEMLRRIEREVRGYPKAALFELASRGHASVFEQLV